MCYRVFPCAAASRTHIKREREGVEEELPYILMSVNEGSLNHSIIPLHACRPPVMHTQQNENGLHETDCLENTQGDLVSR